MLLFVLLVKITSVALWYFILFGEVHFKHIYKLFLYTN